MDIKDLNRLKLLEKVNSFSLILFLLTLACFTFFIFKDIFFNPATTGDENQYLEDLLTAENRGLGKAIINGSSLPYLTLGFFINKFINSPLLSLRLTSLVFGISTIILLIVFENRKIKVSNPIKWSFILWIIYLFVIQTSIFRGINDIVLAFFGGLLWIVFCSSTKSYKNAIIIGLILACMLVTRKMAITYIILFILIYLVASIFEKGFSQRNLLLICTAFFTFFSFLNSYSLIKNQSFSFDDKHLNSEVNWAQWEYHNALLVDEGIQNRYDHVDLKQTQLYLKQNGTESLPTSFSEMIFFNPALTIREFFIDITTSTIFLVRQCGLLTFIFILFFWKRIQNILETKRIFPSDFIYSFGFLYFLIINFIVITNIQPRWFLVFLPFTILLIAKDFKKIPRKSQLIFSITNNFLLIMMSIPYILNKILDF